MAKKENLVHISVNAEILKQWKEEAGKMHISLSELIRIAMRDYLKQN